MSPQVLTLTFQVGLHTDKSVVRARLKKISPISSSKTLLLFWSFALSPPPTGSPKTKARTLAMVLANPPNKQGSSFQQGAERLLERKRPDW